MCACACARDGVYLLFYLTMIGPELYLIRVRTGLELGFMEGSDRAGLEGLYPRPNPDPSRSSVRTDLYLKRAGPAQLTTLLVPTISTVYFFFNWVKLY